MYEYRAEVLSVYDGDTIRIDIDLGFGVWLRNQSVRFRGIDTPEIRGEDKKIGLVARDRVRQLCEENDNKCIIRSFNETGKFGRYLVDVWLGSHPHRSLNTILLDEGLAVKYMK